MSDLPVWVGAAGSVAQGIATSVQVYLGVRGARDAAASEFGRLLDELLEMPADEIVDRLGRPLIAEIVGHAWEAAARTASEQKCWMLARVVVAAVTGGPDDVEIDPLPLLLRTIEAIDEPHVRLLVLVATPRPGSGAMAGTALEGYLRVEDLEEEWPAASELIRPMIAVLERENLIEDQAVGTWDHHHAAYGITAYGRRLLEFLPRERMADLSRSRLTLHMVESGRLRIRNVGLATATAVRVHEPPADDGRSLFLEGAPPVPFDLEPGAHREVELLQPSAMRPLPHQLNLDGHDEEGEQAERFVAGQSPGAG